MPVMTMTAIRPTVHYACNVNGTLVTWMCGPTFNEPRADVWSTRDRLPFHKSSVHAEAPPPTLAEKIPKHKMNAHRRRLGAASVHIQDVTGTIYDNDNGKGHNPLRMRLPSVLYARNECSNQSTDHILCILHQWNVCDMSNMDVSDLGR